jgi:hypothetical protein
MVKWYRSLTACMNIGILEHAGSFWKAVYCWERAYLVCRDGAAQQHLKVMHKQPCGSQQNIDAD